MDQSIGLPVFNLFLKETDAQLTPYLRNSRRLKIVDLGRERFIEGEVNDVSKMKEAMAGQDVGYATKTKWIMK